MSTSKGPRRPKADRGSFEYASGRHQATSDMWGGGSPGISEVKRLVAEFEESPESAAGGGSDPSFVQGYLDAGKEIIAGTHQLSSRGGHGKAESRTQWRCVAVQAAEGPKVQTK